MTTDNTTNMPLRHSPSHSFAFPFGFPLGFPLGENLEGNLEGKRLRKARVLNALLSASALGIFLEGCAASTNEGGSSSSNTPPLVPQGVGVGEILTDAGDDTPVTPKTPETPDTSGGYSDPDSYIVRNEETVTINFDIDGGSLLYRDVTNDELVIFTLYQGDHVEIAVGTAKVWIGSSPALRNGLYILRVGENDDFSGYLYLGTSAPDILTADARGTGRLVGFSGDDVLTGNLATDGINGGAGNDKLYGAGGDDILKGGSDADLLQGGIGNDELLGEGGSDIYIFDAGDGNDLIRGEGDGLDNTLLFRTLSEGAYADADFQFNRGYLSGGETLRKADSGSDLEIVVSQEGGEMNRVIIQQYFSAEDDAYTIYRNSLSVDMIVSTPAETS